MSKFTFASALVSVFLLITNQLKAESKFDGALKDTQKLINEQKYQAASDLIENLIKSASEEDRKSETWADVLTRAAQLKVGLHGYETAVKYIKSLSWPSDPIGFLKISISYAQALIQYEQNYSWEIQKRTQIESKGVLDLKQWTIKDLNQEILATFDKIWKNREKLNALNKNRLPDLINPNSYPEEVRAGLRDSLSFLIVDYLNNTRYWTADQLNQKQSLNIKDLITKSNKEPNKILLSELHPLEKIADVLADLREWNLSRKNQQAVLDAQVSLHEYLHHHFTAQDAKGQLRDSLRKLLEQNQKLAWYSMGMATLANFIQQEQSSDRLIRARSVALRGAEAFPNSLGAKKCRDLIKNIQSPSYEMDGMLIDGPNVSSIGLKYKNIKKVYFRSYRADIPKLIKSGIDYNLWPSHEKAKEIIKDSPNYQWDVSLAETQDFDTHQMMVVPPKHKKGFYLVISSLRPDFREQENVIQSIYMNFSELVLSVRTHPTKNKVEVETSSGVSGQPMPNSSVSLYRINYKTGHSLLDTLTTDSLGYVLFDMAKYESIKPSGELDLNSFFVIAENKDNAAVSRNPLYFVKWSQATEAESSFIFTDRSIFRPGQKIFWKAIVYQGNPKTSEYRIAANKSYTIELRDANNQLVSAKTIVTDDFGSGSGEFEIPLGKALGGWRIISRSDRFAGAQAYIRVEEYKRPSFEVKMLDSKTPLRLNQTAELLGEARYLFGAPVSGGKVKWAIHRSIQLPWWCGFGWGRWDFSWAYREQMIGSGMTQLKENGEFGFRFLPSGDSNLKEGFQEASYTYRISVDVTDQGGETRSTQSYLRVGSVASTLAVTVPQEFYLPDSKIKLKIFKADLNGVPQAGQSNWSLVSVRQPKATLAPSEQPVPEFFKKVVQRVFTTKDDDRLPRWDANYNPSLILRSWPDDQVVNSGKLLQGKNGISELELESLTAGVYRLRLETRDAFGAKVTAAQEILVLDDSFRLNLPAFVAVERQSVKVGQKARLFVGSGFANQRMILETFFNQELINRKELTSGKMNQIIEIPIQEKDRGGFGFGIKMLNDYQAIQLSKTVDVPWDNKGLKINFSRFRDRIKPGEQEKWTFHIKSGSGKTLPAATARAIAYMYDRSLDSFIGHSSASMLSVYQSKSQLSFWEIELGLAPKVYVLSSHTSSNLEYSPPQKDYLQYLATYGIGGPGMRNKGMAVPESLALQTGMLGKADMPAKNNLAEPQQSKDKLADSVAEKKEVDSVSRMRTDRSESGQTGNPVAIRTNFSETAFWQPNLLLSENGIDVEFKVPDSLTSWNLWVNSWTKDLRFGQLNLQTQTVKDLIVRPYLPRFFRQGDELKIKLLTTNMSSEEKSGQVSLEFIDPITQKNISKDFLLKLDGKSTGQFKLKKELSEENTYSVKIPENRLGSVQIKATAISGNFSDGELRELVILPSRVSLVQSQFVSLNGPGKKEIIFKDLKSNKDLSLINEQMVVTLDAQLFYSMMAAMPYLVNYPYECSEQTLNRFLSTSILGSLFKSQPNLAQMASELSKRSTRFEVWNKEDANRKISLEETPWLEISKGGSEKQDELLNMLHPERIEQYRKESIQRLEKIQTASGGFPWFPGGPPSPYMTLYLLYGFSKAMEFGIEVPKPMVNKAWTYMSAHYINAGEVQKMMNGKCCWEEITFLNFVLTQYQIFNVPNVQFSVELRTQMLNYSFEFWKTHSPYLKGYLGLTLNRMERVADAKLVWDSVMDSAQVSEAEGTHWAVEDRSWLWYNDTIETHAFALRAGMELKSDPKKLDGLVHWIFMNKKMNHWKSTRATAEVLYSLARYLKSTNELGIKEDATVTLGGQTHKYEFLPSQYSGKDNKIIIPGAKVNSDFAQIGISKTTGGRLFASANWHFSTDKLPQEGSGDFIKIIRSFYKKKRVHNEERLVPIDDQTELQLGDEIEVHISISTRHPMQYVHLRDPRGAGFEPSNGVSQYKWDLGISWFEEIRDVSTNFFFEQLPKGEYTFKYRQRVSQIGKFRVSPATIQPMYAPEFTSYSGGKILTVKK